MILLGVVGAIVGAVSAVLVIRHYNQDLPDYHHLDTYNPSTISRLYASDGRLLEEYAKERRIFIPINAMPKQLVNAFVAAEDKHYFKHLGIDPIGIARAVIVNLSNLGQNRRLVGGSTITQQVVKNFLLTDERSFERKIKEAILAYRISQVFSKERILELYLNEIYLGLRSYGVAAAALNYFNKSVNELTIEESALIAGMPKAPSDFNPHTNYDRAFQRRNYVLKRMLDDGYITDTQYETAIIKPITLQKRDKTEMVEANYFADEVRKKLITKYSEEGLYTGGYAIHTTIDPALQNIAQKALRKELENYDRRHGYRGAFKNYTLGSLSLDQRSDILTKWAKEKYVSGWQYAFVIKSDADNAEILLKDKTTGAIPLKELKWARQWINQNAMGEKIAKPADVLAIGDLIAVDILSKNKQTKSSEENKNPITLYSLKQTPAVNGAVVALDPHTGKVLAMVGGYAYEYSKFNRATQAKRQPGSAFKPFVYLAALENGFTPADIIVDAEIELEQGGDLPEWRPSNYSGKFYGPNTLRTGVERSMNAMTVRLSQLIGGLKPIVEVGKRFGIYNDLPRNYSVVLGSAETTLLQLTNAYAMLINGGKKVNPSLVEYIYNRNGKIIHKRDNRDCKNCIADGNKIGIPPVIADNRKQVTDTYSAYQMASILEGVVKRGTGRKANKLGHTLGGKTGTTNDSIDSWFIGFSSNLVVGSYIGFDDIQTLGKRETGASIALPVFINVMKDALAKESDVPFRIPSGITLTTIDRKIGKRPITTTKEQDIILEAFKPGTEPSSNGSHIESGLDSGSIGTGGIY